MLALPFKLHITRCLAHESLYLTENKGILGATCVDYLPLERSLVLDYCMFNKNKKIMFALNTATFWMYQEQFRMK